MKTKTLGMTLLVITLVSCAPVITAIPTETVSPNPYKIINHEKPNIQVDFSPFKNIGCNDSYGYENWYRCEEDSPLLNLGCNSIENVPLLGGLSPRYPIALCTLEINEQYADTPDNECIFSDGGFITFCFRYIIYKNDDFQLIKTMDEFRALFAPVESPDEALSFTLAVGQYTAEYNQIKRHDYEYLVQELEDSYIETTTDGYIIHVFYTPSFGCGPFETNSVEVQITHDGQAKEIDRYPIYRTKEIICVD